MEKVEGRSMDQPWYRRIFSGAPDLAVRNETLGTAGTAAEEQFARGVTCGTAEGQNQDFTQAAHWYRQAADQNHPLAQFNLAMMYAVGQGVPQDDALAAGWMVRAAEGGDAGAQFQLGVRCHRASIGGAQPEATELRIEAYKWLRLAATQGYRDSAGCCERVNLDMTREEVVEGNQRVAAFVPSISRTASNEPESADGDELMESGLGQVVITQRQSGQH